MDYLQRIQKVLEANAQKDFLANSKNLFAEIAVEYKHRLSGKFVLANPSEIQKIEGENICITRKLDGEMRTIFFDGKTCVMYTTGGKEEKDFPCLKELSEKLISANIKCAGLVAELNYLNKDGKRSRVTDVIHAIANPALHESLALSPFDILFLDGKKWQVEHYEKTYAKLEELFGETQSGQIVSPVQMEKGNCAADIARVYKKWVTKEKAEGLVVHTEQPVIWKIKPLHTIDAVAIGYTTGENGIRDLLFAVMEPSGLYRIFASGGNGLTMEHRKLLEYTLGQIAVPSNLIYTDSQGVAFQMIKPEYVFEVTAIDFAGKNCLHDVYKNYITEYSQEKGWVVRGKVPGVTTYSLSIVRLRDDKKCVEPDIAVRQIQNIYPFDCADVTLAQKEYPLSTIVQREAFYKKSGRSAYIKKFVLVKTNKDTCGQFPKFFLHFTDYSSNRKEKMKITVYCSSSKTELEEKMQTMIYKSIKSGWQKY